MELGFERKDRGRHRSESRRGSRDRPRAAGRGRRRSRRGTHHHAGTPGIGRAVPVAVDLSTEVGGTLLIDRALAELGGVDLVVNNVGGGEVDLGGFLDLSEQALARPLRHQPVRGPAREPGGVADPHPAGRRDRQRLLDRRLAAGRTAAGVQRR